MVYGGTSAGVTAAVQAAKEGKSVVLIAPEGRLGAMSSAGLGMTDSGKTATIGGLSREFYHRVWREYRKPETWKWQKRENFGRKGAGTKAIDDERKVMWIFEPSVAEKVFEDWVKEHKNIRLVRGEPARQGVRRRKGWRQDSRHFHALRRQVPGKNVHRLHF